MKYTAAAALLSLCAVARASDVYYEQTIRANFKSPEDAARAQAQIAPLPEGKTIAFSSRWDDSNLRHLATAKMLAERGMKSTCYLVDVSSPAIRDAAKKIVGLGGSIGSHTLTHPFLPTLLPNEIFREIAKERVVLESTFDEPVVAFVLPYVSCASPADPNVKKYVGQSILRAGYLASPEPHGQNKINYAYPDGVDVFSTKIVRADDRNPKESIYKNTLEAALKAIDKGADAHMTLGIHSWQDDDGLARLGSYIDKYKSDAFWYCNENEYAAYRKQALDSKIERTGANANAATFKVRRPSSVRLGSNIPLEIKISPAPVSAEADGAPAELSAGSLKLAPAREMRVPKKIEMLSFDGAGRAQSAKFKGLSAYAAFDGETLNFGLENSGGAKAEKLSYRIIAPPCFDIPNPDEAAYEKFDGKKFAASQKLAANSHIGDFRDGKMFVAAEIDFIFAGEPSRLYLAVEKDNPVAALPCPRDCVAVSKPVAKADLPDAEIAAMSNAGARLSEKLKWEVSPDKKLREFHFSYNGRAVRAEFPKGDFAVLGAVDILAPRDGDFSFVLDKNMIEAVYVNGVKMQPRANALKIPLKKGANRVILEFGKKSEKRNSPMLCARDGSVLLNCATPAF